MMIPLILLGISVGLLIKVASSQASLKDTPTRIEGESPIDLTPHLSEFARVIRDGHRPNQWLVTEAINEAYRRGDWRMVRAISDNYPSTITEKRRKPKPVETPIEEVTDKSESKESPKELPAFQIKKTTSPIDGVSDDDWRMFVHSSLIESPEFNSDNSLGMFRQNKKRLVKLGVTSELKTPVEQYGAFEKEISQLMIEGQNLSKLHVAMPVEVDGENVPITLSGLLAVMRAAGTQNAEKWLDSSEERNKFPNTTKAFKRSNGCF